MGRTILFATDGSENSRRAEETAIDVANEDDRVVVLHVVPETPPYIMGEDYDALELDQELQEASNQITSESAERISEAGLDTDSIVVQGHAGETICEQAEELGADHIVLGRRGRGTAGELLLGSVSHYVIQHAEVPVTVTGPVNSS
jgi:nucleotide-binding universal stress UspA family protein